MAEQVKQGPVAVLARAEEAASILSASAIPTAVASPWPSGPGVVSTPSVWPYSGWPGVLEPT